MASTFKVGDTVGSRHGVSKIKRIEIVEPGQKECGIEVNEYYWSLKNQVVVDLENGHWAYGDTIRQELTSCGRNTPYNPWGL